MQAALRLSLLVPLLACSNQSSAETASSAQSAPVAPQASAVPSPTEPTPAAAQVTEEKEPYTPAREPQFGFEPGGAISDEALDDYHVVLSCAVDGKDVGTITLDLWADAAPITVRNFLRLCDEGFYDGVTFHRIIRDFMVQGGDPTGTGMGDSPHGTIEAEFSDDPARAHGYGVISMARSGDPNSASSQFFICCDESAGVWNLDGNYASFGRMTDGVETLEALANVPTGGPQKSTPQAPVTIVRAEVRKGPAPESDETIVRPEPAPDLGGEPERVVVQHVLVSFDGVPQLQVARTREEALALAEELLAKAKAGEDFTALVRASSDDPVQEGDPAPGTYQLLNLGVRDRKAEKKMFELTRRFQEDVAALEAQQRAGTLTPQEVQEKQIALREAAMDEARPFLWMGRDGMVPAFGDVAFSLEVGEVGLAPYDAKSSPFGWHIIKRLE